MRIFIDTNILIDVITARQPFCVASSNILNLGIEGKVKLFTTPLTFATCVFVGRKILGYDGAIKAMQVIENYVSVATMDKSQCHRALFSSMPDFEDMLQYESAIAADCDIIVTRNKKHFPKDSLPIVEPSEFFDNYWNAD